MDKHLAFSHFNAKREKERERERERERETETERQTDKEIKAISNNGFKTVNL